MEFTHMESTALPAQPTTQASAAALTPWPVRRITLHTLPVSSAILDTILPTMALYQYISARSAFEACFTAASACHALSTDVHRHENNENDWSADLFLRGSAACPQHPLQCASAWPS